MLPELRVGAPVAGLAPRPTVLLVAGFAVPRRRAGAVALVGDAVRVDEGIRFRCRGCAAAVEASADPSRAGKAG
ncbi:hypothetical protein, partial [Nocardia abscessus]|uniref:hypothetical protein n=1 Tax=Nocardia abscessus TaxID=120957 RepID=UPI002457F9F2